MFIRHLENRDVCFWVEKIYLEGDHYVAFGYWVNTSLTPPRIISSKKMPGPETITIDDLLVHNWRVTYVEEPEELKDADWVKLKGKV